MEVNQLTSREAWHQACQQQPVLVTCCDCLKVSVCLDLSNACPSNDLCMLRMWSKGALLTEPSTALHCTSLHHPGTIQTVQHAWANSSAVCRAQLWMPMTCKSTTKVTRSNWFQVIPSVRLSDTLMISDPKLFKSLSKDAKWCKSMVMFYRFYDDFLTKSSHHIDRMMPDPIQQPPQHRSQHPGITWKCDGTACCINLSTSAFPLILDVLDSFNHLQSMQAVNAVIQIKQTYNLHLTSGTLKGVCQT